MDHTTTKIPHYTNESFYLSISRKNVGKALGISQCKRCPVVGKKKIFLTSQNESSGTTANQQIANIIRFYPGGRVFYGNEYTTLLNPITNPNPKPRTIVTLMGKTEGQPGGIQGPLRNKF